MTGKQNKGCRALVALVAVVALAAPGGALASNGKSQSGKNGPAATITTNGSQGSSLTVQGVVQSVGATFVVVKQLDGSTVTVPVDRKTTQVFVNNRHVQLTDVKPGYVLSASWKAGRAAPTLKSVRPF